MAALRRRREQWADAAAVAVTRARLWHVYLSQAPNRCFMRQASAMICTVASVRLAKGGRNGGGGGGGRMPFEVPEAFQALPTVS